MGKSYLNQTINSPNSRSDRSFRDAYRRDDGGNKQAPLEHQSTYTRLHSTLSQKTVTSRKFYLLMVVFWVVIC